MSITDVYATKEICSLRLVSVMLKVVTLQYCKQIHAAYKNNSRNIQTKLSVSTYNVYMHVVFCPMIVKHNRQQPVHTVKFVAKAHAVY